MQSRRQKYLLFWFVLKSLKGLIRNATASSIKVLIGREAYFNQNERFLIDYVAYKLGLGSEIKLTASCLPSEGAASQARLRMIAICLSRLLNINYAHSPFTAIAHNELGLQGWDAAWEHHFNLGFGEQPVSEHRESGNAKLYDISQNYTTLIRFFGPEHALELCGIYNEVFKEKYYSNKVSSSSPSIRVVAHVRRGDVSENTHETLWTKNSAVYETFLCVKRILQENNLQYSLKLFSEGDKNDFSEFEDLGTEIFVNGDPINVMQELIAADVLIMAKGFFSYISGVISDGVALYDPWDGNPPLKNWIIRSLEGDFDENVFEVELAKIIAEKKVA
jgi:hypothetical protein